MKTNKIKSKMPSPREFPEAAFDASAGGLEDFKKPDKAIPEKPGIAYMPTGFQKTADDILLSKYAPVGIVVNEAMDIVHFRGRTANYLEQAPGKPSHNLINMAKDGLAFDLRNILNKAKKENASVIKENISLLINGSRRNIAIEAIPLPNMMEPHYLILFHDKNETGNQQAASSNKRITTKAKKDEDYLRIRQLEQKLEQMREDMRSNTEDQEAANEELQSANEELQSGSEELQSLNDELETSKEELQSANEQLTVVNQVLIGLNGQVTTERNYTESIIATIGEPLLVLDKNFRIKTANSAFYKTFRVNEQETEGALIYDLGNKQWDIAKLHTLLEEILPQKTKITDYEVTHVFPGIGERVMQLNASEIIREKGEEKLILLSIQDITERVHLKLKEDDLHNKAISERKAMKIRLEKAVEERTKELAQANKELSFQNEEKEKRAAELIIANKELAFQNEEKEKRAAELIIANKELVVKNEEKEKRAAELIIANKELAFQNEEKEKRAAELIIANKELAFQNDEKENRAAELIIANKELAFQNDEKENRAAELIIANKELAFQNDEKENRAAELIIANKELAFQNDEKENRAAELIIANKELESFAYISSHDLQEPLRKIQTFANRILEKENQHLSDNAKDYFRRMQSAANRMQQLIEDLLAFSQINMAERKFENTGLDKIVADVKNELKEAIEEKHATIEATVLCPANIIPFQFSQLINNLISNSLKFSKPETPPHILIKSRIEKGSELNIEKNGLPAGRLSPKKNYCHISFTDNGIGFDPQYKDKIFEVFQRLHGKEEYAGTGIGLAIVKKIIDNHNGIITASGELNKGTTFDIYIPAF